MGCGPSKGNTIAVQSAQTPRAAPDFRAAPPVTPPIKSSKENKENLNPLDVKRPLPAIGGDSKPKKPGLSTVPEAGEEATGPAWMKPDMNAMISDAKSGEHNQEVKHTQSSVAFTFSFGDMGPSRAPGRLPPLIREKTMKKETDEKDLKDSLTKRQQEADSRRKNELESISKKQKKRKVKLKKNNSVGIENESSAAENEEGARRESIVPPLEIPSSSDKNGSLPSGENQSNENKTSSDQQKPTTLQNGAIPSSVEDNPRLDPRNGSAHHDSTYGSGDETGVDTQARVIDPLRRFSKRRKGKTTDSKKGIDADDEFYSGEEDVNPIEATNFFDD